MDSLRRTGQDKRFLEGELAFYLQKFEEIYIFDYSNVKFETNDKRIIQIYNSSNFHRYLYAFIFPILNRQIIKNSSIIRASHVTGMISGLCAKLLSGKKIVFNYAYDYAGFAWQEKKFIRSILLAMLSRLCFFLSDGVIVASKIFFDKLSINHKSRTKYIWIPNGVDTELFFPQIKDNKTRNYFYEILFVGRLTEQKNLINLIEGIKKIGVSSIKLTIVGTGELENKICERCEKYKIRLKLISRVENENLKKYYNSCDLFVLPSFNEGSSKVLLEAMSSGCVCLVSRIKENMEIIANGKNGFICGFSADEIADGLKYAMQFKNSESIGLSARRTIEENYSMAKVLKKEVDFVKSYV